MSQFKVTFARIVNVAQLVEGIIEADSEELANDAFDRGEFKRFLVVKQEQREVTPVGKPEFDQLS